MSDTNSGKKQGAIDLVRLFQAEALDLIGAVARGRVLHGTHNIRDSGAPLESQLREFLQSRLPSQFKVTQGYLFDSQSKCSPQIDAMIVNSADCHELMVSPEGSGYLPFTSALAVIEIKNSARNVADNLDQLMSVVTSIKTMQSDLHKRRPGAGERLEEPISVMFFGDSGDSKLEDFKVWFKKAGRNVPTYTVLLDRAVILANRGGMYAYFDGDDEPAIDFYEHRNGHTPFLCIPEICDESKMGRALLWLYFAIVAHTNLCDGNMGKILAFTNDAMLSYRLRAVSPLSEIDNWKAVETLTGK